MNPTDLAAELVERVRASRRDDLLALVRALDLARDVAVARLAAHDEADRWITVDDAGEIAQATRARIRTWARREGVTWAAWPTRKNLRVHEGRFRAWLSGEPRLSARTAANRSNERPRGGRGTRERARTGRRGA